MEVTLSRDSISQLAVAIADIIAGSKNEKLVGIKELSTYINTPVDTIYRWVNNARQNKMPFLKPGKCLQFRISDVQKWMEDR